FCPVRGSGSGWWVEAPTVPVRAQTSGLSRERNKGGRIMTTAKDIMHEGVQCIETNTNLVTAARMMRDLGIGALPICGEDNRLKGIITDRDIVVKCLAEGKDPNTCSAIELAEGTPFYVDASDDIETLLQEMKQHKVKRMPVDRKSDVEGKSVGAEGGR